MKNVRLIYIGAGALLLLGVILRLNSILAKPVVMQTAVVSDSVPALSAPGVAVPDAGGGQAMISSAGVFRRSTGSAPPVLTAQAAVIIDPESTETLLNLNPGMRWPIASLTKLMTAHIVISKMNLAEDYTLLPTDFESGGNSFTQNLAPGAKYSGRDLLRIMLTSSSNEAAEAFARTYGRDAFISAMNAEAAVWGLLDTHFADPSGLSAGNQSTARDMALLGGKVLQLHPEVFRITTGKSATVTEERSGTRQVFANIDQLAGQADFLGGKTGTTPQAGENLLALFSYRAHPVMILVFGSADRYKDAKELLNWFTHDFIPGN